MIENLHPEYQGLTPKIARFAHAKAPTHAHTRTHTYTMISGETIAHMAAALNRRTRNKQQQKIEISDLMKNIRAAINNRP